MKSERKFSAIECYSLAFGLFLGLALLKFGNPVILDGKITPPVSISDYLHDPWPTHWANWILVPIVLAGGVLALVQKKRRTATGWGETPGEPQKSTYSVGSRRRPPQQKWLWLLPLLWFGWQLLSATQTVDATLTGVTLWQFFGCVACYFLGSLFFGRENTLCWLLIGVLAAFTFCLVRAIDQRLFEFPQSRQMLIEGERTNWTNLPPESLLEMKREDIIITTNGVDVANPAILTKFAKGRVNGTLVYPNALAGAILLLFPMSLVLAFNSTKRLRPAIRNLVIALTLFLGASAFFWSGSKLGWLIAIAVGGACLFRLRWPARFKWLALILILVAGLGIFAIRFHDYFAGGATSAGARFDYWRAAAQTSFAHPVLGTGPGTFQRPYAQLKSPEAEMARLTHNDYLEQFSDSGFPGGVLYGAWILLAMTFTGRKIWTAGSLMAFAAFAGLLGWFLQGLGEFGLYVPALAWTAFTLLGGLLAQSGNEIDKPAAAN
jgi:O-antigen ligase